MSSGDPKRQHIVRNEDGFFVPVNQRTASASGSSSHSASKSRHMKTPPERGASSMQRVKGSSSSSSSSRVPIGSPSRSNSSSAEAILPRGSSRTDVKDRESDRRRDDYGRSHHSSHSEHHTKDESFQRSYSSPSEYRSEDTGHRYRDDSERGTSSSQKYHNTSSSQYDSHDLQSRRVMSSQGSSSGYHNTSSTRIQDDYRRPESASAVRTRGSSSSHHPRSGPSRSDRESGSAVKAMDELLKSLDQFNVSENVSVEPASYTDQEPSRRNPDRFRRKESIQDDDHNPTGALERVLSQGRSVDMNSSYGDREGQSRDISRQNSSHSRIEDSSYNRDYRPSERATLEEEASLPSITRETSASRSGWSRGTRERTRDIQPEPSRQQLSIRNDHEDPAPLSASSIGSPQDLNGESSLREEELDQLEDAETRRQRAERERLRQQQREADRAEAAMVAKVRERKLAEEKSNRTTTEFSLLSNAPIQESVLVLDYVHALRETLRADKVMSPVPEDFAYPDGFETWNRSVRMTLQEVLRRLLKLKFSSRSERNRGPADASVKMTFRIKEARNLVAKEGRSRNAYCEIEVGSSDEIAKRRKAKKVEVLRTQVVQNTCNPRWDQKLTFEAKNLTDRIEVDVIDDAKDQFLGRAKFIMGDLIERCAREGHVTLRSRLGDRDGNHRDKYVGGELVVDVEMEQEDPRKNRDLSNAASSDQLISQLKNCRLNFRSLFMLLSRACLTLDLHAPPEDKTSDLFSFESSTMLRMWAREWGISQAYQVVSYLQLVFQRYRDSAGRMPISEVLKAFDILYANVRKDGWLSSTDREIALKLLEDMNDFFQTHVSKYKESYPRNKPPGALETAVLILRMIHRFPAYRQAHPQVHESFREELRTILTEACISRFQRFKEITAPFDETDIESVIEGINKLAEMVSEEIESDDKYFRDPFAKELDIVRLTAENHLKYFVLTLEDTSELLSSDEAVGNASKMVFALYKRVKVMNDRYSKIVPALSSMASGLSAERWFAPFMKTWLDKLSEKTVSWVVNAVKADSFEPLEGVVTDDGIPAHSSSITDVFSAIYAELEFITDLGWSDSVQNAHFFQAFAKTVNCAIEQYCDAIAVGETTRSSTTAASSVTSYLLGTKSSEEPQDINMESCVKLRNIEFAMGKLKEIYKLMNVAAITRIVREHRQQQNHQNPSRSGGGSARNSANHSSGDVDEKITGAFKIHIAYAENVKPVTRAGLANPYLVIRVPEGTVVPVQEPANPGSRRMSNGEPPQEPTVLKGPACELLRTRVINDTLNPSFNETFQVILPPITRLEIATFSKNLLTADDLVGAAVVDMSLGTRLRRRVVDHQTHDVYIELEPQGRVLMRLTMEGEEEDIDFWFRRTNERLIRMRDDFLRSLTYKISPYTRDVLAKAIKDHEAAPLPSRSFFSSLTSGTQLSEETSSGASIHKAITDAEGDKALQPLTSYLDRNLELLCGSLSPTMAHEVIKRIWEDTLSALEAILIPPLYGQMERERRVLNKRQSSMVDFSVQELRAFFHGDGGELGLPLRVLDTRAYLQIRALLSVYHESDLRRLKQEYERSNSGGGSGEKEYLLRLIRLYVEKDEKLSTQEKEDGKSWIESQLQKRGDQSRR